MKLIIEIPEEDYKFIKDLQSLIIGSRGTCKTIQQNVINAIRNGTPYNPTGDLISRDALQEEHSKECIHNCYYCQHFKWSKKKACSYCDVIDNAPIISIDWGIDNGDRTVYARPHENWIPVTYRPMTKEEEKELCEKWGVKELEDWERRVFTCPLPEDNQEILISTCWGVSEDVCTWDDGCFGLEDRGDWDGVDAWMPKPEPYKKEGEKE